jgi:hypothetical protein
MRIRKSIVGLTAMAILAVPGVAMAAGGPTSGPVANQPGNSCFGNWRAGSGQDVKAGLYAGFDNLGDVISARAQAGTVADHNVSDKAQC